MSINSINRQNCKLAEGPIWNKNYSRLFWTDINDKCIWCYNPETQSCKIVWHGDSKVGGFTFTKKNELILCSDKGVFKVKLDKNLEAVERKQKKLFDIEFSEDERFNDIITDPMGRIFAGTLKPNCTDGVLYRLEKGKKPIVVLDKLGISNGMAFSMDEKSFFHNDSKTRTISKYKYNNLNGEISNPTIFFVGKEEDGLPDGITIDINDNLWVACWGGEKVLHIDQKGEIIEEVKIPAKQVSSVVFGGENLNQLFVTTASEGAIHFEDGLDKDGIYLGGKVFCHNTNTYGRYEWLYK